MAAAVAMAAEVAMASAVAMAAEVHCQREPSGCTSAQYLSSSNYQPSQILYSPSLNHRVHQKLSPKSGGVSLYTNKVFEQFCRFISAPALPVMVAFLYVYIQSSIETAIYEAEKVKQSWNGSATALVSCSPLGGAGVHFTQYLLHLGLCCSYFKCLGLLGISFDIPDYCVDIVVYNNEIHLYLNYFSNCGVF